MLSKWVWLLFDLWFCNFTLYNLSNVTNWGTAIWCYRQLSTDVLISEFFLRLLIYFRVLIIPSCVVSLSFALLYSSTLNAYHCYEGWQSSGKSVFLKQLTSITVVSSLALTAVIKIFFLILMSSLFDGNYVFPLFINPSHDVYVWYSVCPNYIHSSSLRVSNFFNVSRQHWQNILLLSSLAVQKWDQS